MKQTFTSRLLIAVTALLVAACSGEGAQAQTATTDMKMSITIDGKTLAVNLVDNEATRTLLAALQESPITYEADDYGGFEKVGALGRSLPTSNQQITTEAGDVILYSGNQIVLFYGSNSWSYTRIGRMEYDSPAQLRDFLKAGQGRVSVTLSAQGTSAVRAAKAGGSKACDYTALNGGRTKAPAKGVYIKNGKKYIR